MKAAAAAAPVADSSEAAVSLVPAASPVPEEAMPPLAAIPELLSEAGGGFMSVLIRVPAVLLPVALPPVLMSVLVLLHAVPSTITPATKKCEMAFIVFVSLEIIKLWPVYGTL
jgi:hypothetical protein